MIASFSFAVALSVITAATSVNVKSQHQYGSKTPYDLTYTNWADVLYKEAEIPDTCKLAHFRLVARHGTRSYGKDDIEATELAVQKIRTFTKLASPFPAVPAPTGEGPISLDQLYQIRDWTNQLLEQKDLLERGRLEHEFLARDYFRMLSQSGLVEKSLFSFESSNVSRAQASAEAFRGQWDKLMANPDPETIRVNDTKFYFHKNCPAYQTHIGKNATAEHEMEQAKSSKQALDLIEKINKQRLLLPENILDWNDIFAMYTTASFEYAAFNESVFQPLYDFEDEAFLEYVDDLSQFWTGAYGNQLIADMSCPLLNDIFESAEVAYEARRQGANLTMNSFGFTHLEILMPIYSAFDLFHDDERAYKSGASRYIYQNRQFDSSDIGKFASNVAFLFLECTGVGNIEDKQLVLLVNGKPQALTKACPYTLTCPLSSVKRAYPRAAGYPEKCNFEQVCSLDSYQSTYGQQSDMSKTTPVTPQMTAQPCAEASKSTGSRLISIGTSNLVSIYLFIWQFLAR